MKVAVISNIREQKGLAVDARVLDSLLTAWGHEVETFDFREVRDRRRGFHLVIHLEVVAPAALWWSDNQWWFPNPDWCTAERLSWADAFRLILAKSRAGERALLDAGVNRVAYVGFEAADRYIPEVPRERRFFHTWGGSLVKGTRSVTKGLAGLTYPSTLVLDRMSATAIQREQNRCLFHIQPSQVEGFGHILHEATSVGALLATTDAPPMNEVPGLVLGLKAKRVARQRLADVYDVLPETVRSAAKTLMGLSDREVKTFSANAREQFLHAREEFRTRLRRLL